MLPFPLLQLAGPLALLARQTACLGSLIAAGSSVCVLAVIASDALLRARKQPKGCYDQKASIDSFTPNQAHSTQ
jgi:hypothetical protein